MADTKVSALTAKAAPVTGDIIHILDSESSNADKRTTLGAYTETRLGGAGAPSATELGYVKGVTSAIQTQVGGLIAKSLGTEKGALVGFSAANTPGTLAKGDDGQVLTADAASTLGVKWAAGSAGTANAVTVANEATDTTCFPVFVTAATGDLGPKTNANLTFNSNTAEFTVGAIKLVGSKIQYDDGGGFDDKLDFSVAPGDLAVGTGLTISAGSGTAALANSGVTIGVATGYAIPNLTAFTGPATTTKTFTLPDADATLLYSGGALGTPSGGTLTNCTGGAATTAATLATARAINGVNFDGSAAITVREVPVTTLPSTGNYIADSPPLGALNAVTGGISQYDLVYVDGSGTISKAKADSATTTDAYIGMATAAASAGNPVTVLKSGLITNSGWSWTPGAKLYISEATAGLITSTAPSTTGNQVKIVGIAISATCIQLVQGHPSVEVP